MFKGIILSVMALILVMLGIIEFIYNRRQKVEGWEAEYFRKRLRRRLFILALLIPILLSLLYMDQLVEIFPGPWWALAYMSASMIMILIVLILAAIDALSTIKYAIHKHSEITSSSIKTLRKRFQQKDMPDDTDKIGDEE